MLIKLSLIIIIFMIIDAYKLRKRGNLFPDEESALLTASEQLKNMYKEKKESLISDIYEKLELKEVISYASNLIKSDKTSDKSFRKLNDLINKVPKADTKIKNNPLVKKTLQVMIKDRGAKIEDRVKAAQLAARLNDMPVTIQITAKQTTKKPDNYDAYVIVPRATRLYRPDKIIENYKTGNWDA